MTEKISIQIAIICNMNNNNFALARYLRDAGYNARLFLLDHEREGHFHPKADTYSLEYMNWVEQTNWNWKALISRKKCEIIKQKLCSYNIIICTNRATALMGRINRKIDIVLSHGSDIYQYTYYYKYLTWRSLFNTEYLLKHIFYTYYQRKGLKNSKIIHVGQTHVSIF